MRPMSIGALRGSRGTTRSLNRTSLSLSAQPIEALNNYVRMHGS